MLKPRNQKAPAMKSGFNASVTPAGELEILIYDEIGSDWWDGGITAKTIRQSLDAAGVYSKILVRINSPGGDAFEGIAIGNVLKATGKPIDVCIDGLAASAASIIAMCGTTITIASNGMMMVHNAWTMCMGYASDMRKMADTLEIISTSIAQTYVDKTGKPMAEIQALMDAETWLNSADCLAGGFATAVEAANEPGIALAKSFKVLNLLKHVPESLQNKKADEVADNANGCECACDSCQASDCSNCSNADCGDAKCENCPMQADAQAKAILTTELKRARLTLAMRRNKV